MEVVNEYQALHQGLQLELKIFADCVRTPRQPVSCFFEASIKHEQKISNEKEGGEKKTGDQRREKCWAY